MVGCFLQVWSTTFYMGKFGGPTAKRHRLWSNDAGLLEEIHQRAGHLSKEERLALQGEPLAKMYVDSKGFKRYAGIPDKLKASQSLCRISSCLSESKRNIKGHRQPKGVY